MAREEYEVDEETIETTSIAMRYQEALNSFNDDIALEENKAGGETPKTKQDRQALSKGQTAFNHIFKKR